MTARGWRIALCPLNQTVGDLAGNVDRIFTVYAEAARQGADIVVTPEMSLTGYPIEDLALRPAFMAAVAAARADLIARVGASGLKAALVFGHPVPATVLNGDQLLAHNAATFLEPAQGEAVRLKVELANYGPLDEKRTFAPGPPPLPIEFRGSQVGILICEDGWSTGPAAALAGAGVDLVLWLNASPYALDKPQRRRQLLRERAAQLSAPIVYINMAGGQGEIIFDGHCLAASAAGDRETAPFKGGMQIIDLPRSPPSLTEPVPPALRFTVVGEAYLALVTGLRDYLRKQHFASAVIGMSGGIDSALAAAIAVDALGPDNVHLVRLPSRFSSSGSLIDAAAARDLLGCRMRTIEIEPAVEALRQAYPAKSVADENLQARVRGVLLMAISNQEGHLLIATGNKSELAVGYGTLYGDMAGGYNVLKDVYKTLVSVAAGQPARTEAAIAALVAEQGPGLVQWRNALTEPAAAGLQGPPGRVVPHAIEAKAESAELAPGQQDSDSLPLYPLLDAILARLLEGNCGVHEVAAEGFSQATVEQVNTLVNRAEYKRRQGAPGPRITEMLFDADRRLPLVNAFKG